jgi:hypothetical protein
MDNEIDITMLGSSGSGKTCYMLGMYAKFHIGDQRGFMLSAADLDDDIRLTSLWETIVSLKNEKRWPPPNAGEVLDYKFSLDYGFKPIMSFNWMDYRGDAMRDSSSEEDVRKLIDRLQRSSCIFLCVSGEHLTERLDRRFFLIARDAQADRMNQFMIKVFEAARPTSQRPFPVVVVITKYDICAHRRPDEVVADVKRMFPSLFVPGSGWLTMICPVSLGKGLVQDRNRGDIDPINIHIPVMFAIYAKLREVGAARSEQIESLREAIAHMRQRNWLIRLLTQSELDDRVRSSDELEREIEGIRYNMELLIEDLRKRTVYRGAEEIQLEL